jgi:hypothetical protein
MSGEDTVRLAIASTPFEAHLWRQALEEENIPCKVVGDYLEAGVGDISGIQPEVWVHRDDYARARAILDAHPHSVGEPEE